MGNRSALKSCLTQNVRGNTLQRYVDYAVNLGGVTACWPLQEASGGRRDFAGDSPLTDNNTVTGGNGPGGLEDASDFEASTSESLSAADVARHTFLGDMTVICLANPEAIPAAAMNLLGKDDAANAREYGLYYENTVDRYRFVQGNANWATLDIADADAHGAPVAGAWVQIEGDVNTVLATVGIRVNNGTRNAVTKTTTMVNGTEGFAIGSRRGATPALFWDGLIAGALLVRRILQRCEAQRLYELGMGRTP